MKSPKMGPLVNLSSIFLKKIEACGMESGLEKWLVASIVMATTRPNIVFTKSSNVPRSRDLTMLYKMLDVD